MKIKYTIFKKDYKRNDSGVIEKSLSQLGQIEANEKGAVINCSPGLLNYENEKPPLRELLRRWGNGAYYEYHSSVVVE